MTRSTTFGIAVAFLFVFALILYMADFKVDGRNPNDRIPLASSEPIGDRTAVERSWLKFAPRHNFTECLELFGYLTEAADFKMSKEFLLGLQEFLDAFKKAIKNESVEGNSYANEKYFRTLHYLARELPFVRTVCESGFNAGHSAYNFLTAKPTNILHTFDIGQHVYGRHMARFLAEKFPGRFHVHWGDSRKSIPLLLESNAGNVVCDLFHIDGGHYGDVPLKDLRHFSRLSNLENNIVFMDNVDMRDVDTAWKQMERDGVVRPLPVRCQMNCPWGDEIALGTYISRHQLNKTV